MAAQRLPIPTMMAGKRDKTVLWPEWVTIGTYAAFLIFIIPFHEPWADEAQSWQLARSVPLVDLFKSYLRYEGSPGLWHFVLAILDRLHVSYAGMHWFSAAIAFTGIVLLVLYAPFPRYIRLALPFTYFLAFQYAVVARSYVFVPLLLFAIAMCWRRNPILIALFLGLLGNLSMHSFAISGGFALVYCIDLLRRRRNFQESKLIFAAILLAGFYAFALWTVLPRPMDLSRPWPFRSIPLVERLETFSLRAILAPIVPIATPLALAILAVPCWIYFAAILRRATLLYYGLPVIAFALFSGYHYNFWHTGLLVPTVIAICWITWPEINSAAKFAPLFAGYCIALQIGWTIHAAAFDYARSYSPDAETARFLAPHVAAGESIAVTYINDPDLDAYHSIGIAPYFSHPIFVNQKRPFWLWSTREHTDNELIATLSNQPPIVVGVFYDNDGHLFNANRDLLNPRSALLEVNGYQLTHTFCGEKPEGFREREEICHLIFEKKR
jgi:hypothetical protein